MMKITKERLEKIIKEELSEMERVPVPFNDPFGPDQTREIKSHLSALKRIFDEVGLKNVPDEMKRGWSKMRGGLERIPGLKEELEEGDRRFRHYPRSSAPKGMPPQERRSRMSIQDLAGYFIGAAPDPSNLRDIKFYRIRIEVVDEKLGAIEAFITMNGKKVFLKRSTGSNNSRLAIPSGSLGRGGNLMGRTESGDEVHLGSILDGAGRINKRNELGDRLMGQP